MKVAIVCDWLLGTGGAERVVEQLHKMFPAAPIYTSYCTAGWRQKLDHKVVTGYLQKWPFSKARKFLPVLRGLWFSNLKFDGYDLVISSGGAESKFIKVKKPALHINYCYTPTHYYWVRYDEYLKNPGFGLLDPIARLGLKLLIVPMRRWDYRAAQRADFIIAISNYVKENIKKYYDRDSVVIHPPVDIERFKEHNQPAAKRHGFITAGRQTPYKRFDIAVEAATMLKVPLIVMGKGPEHRWLKKLAGRSVIFLTQVTDEQMAERFGEAKAFIFPGVDDFGIVAVEAMAAGTPVIAYRAGGALDYVNEHTGLFFNEQTPESLAKAIESFSKKDFNHAKIAAHAAKFSPVVFQSAINDFVKQIPRIR